jgi:hypothetical protein
MMLRKLVLGTFLLASALSAPIGTTSMASAATFVVINGDSAREGFNDPTRVAPVGGNPGTTIGQQRMNAFRRAASIWGARLRSSVQIRVFAQFNPLSCTASSGILGSAGPETAVRDFPGAPVAATWYPIALANARRGADLSSGNDIGAQFNSNVGRSGCLTSSGWYYGYDRRPPAGKFDFITVLLHELGHGLGFLTFVDLATGTKMMGFNDAFMRFLENHSGAPHLHPAMTNGQRIAASKATGALHWIGPYVRAGSSVLTAGRVGDHVRMYAPNPQQAGSSVSHFDTALAPNQLMEPFYTVPIHTPVLEIRLFRDIGWLLP